MPYTNNATKICYYFSEAYSVAIVVKKQTTYNTTQDYEIDCSVKQLS